LGPHKGSSTGDAWPSSVRGLSCSLKWGNERNPCRLLYVSDGTAQPFAREASKGNQKSEYLPAAGRSKSETNSKFKAQNLKYMFCAFGFRTFKHCFEFLILYFEIPLRLRAKGWEEGGDDARSARPSDALGCTHNTMVTTTGCDGVILS